MRDSWDRRIRRADELAEQPAERCPAKSLLTFYARLLRAQKRVYESLAAPPPLTGSLEDDLPRLEEASTPILREVAAHGPEQLSRSAYRPLGDEVLSYWRAPTDKQFFAKAILQPYAQRLREAGRDFGGRGLTRADNRCPSCGGSPQLSILDTPAATGDAGGRLLLCSCCLTSWTFRRLECAHCGEQSEPALGYFESPAYDHVRVTVCERCHRYIKTVDLARLGLAVPLVDEVAAAALDVWAVERGYTKIELNLLGL